MATFTKHALSGSTDGKQIAVAATATAGTLIHTATSGTTNWDEIVLSAVNISGTDVLLTIEYGGATAADQIKVLIPAQGGLTLVVPGHILNNGAVVRAFAATTNVINISGYVNRVTA